MPGARWLRTERDKRGWTGTELARRLGIAQERVSAYERAQDEPPPEVARGLAQEFGLTELEVWRHLGKPHPELDIEAMTGPEIVAYVRRVHPGELEAILGEPEPSPDARSASTRGKASRRSRKQQDVTHPDEPGRSASRG